MEQLNAALAIHFYHYNFMRIHETIRVTPAMEAGLTKHIWNWRNCLESTKQESGVILGTFFKNVEKILDFGFSIRYLISAYPLRLSHISVCDA